MLIASSVWSAATSRAVVVDHIDYEALVVAELAAAASAGTIEARKRHLDKAAMLAAEGERVRRINLTRPGR